MLLISLFRHKKSRERSRLNITALLSGILDWRFTPIGPTTMRPVPQILLSFDIEEFDVPDEYGHPIGIDEQFQVSAQGLREILALLDRLDLVATFFVTANFALHHPDLLRQMAERHEIASHGFYHSRFETADLEKSRLVLEDMIGRSVRGFRMARLQPVSDWEIQAAGYAYNSSMNPTYLPGRYNNLGRPRLPYYAGNLLNIPVSVTPGVRFPLFWLSFKNLPLGIYQFLCRLNLSLDRQLNLYFHPWEFSDIQHYQLPGYIKKHAGTPMLQRLERYLLGIQPHGKFVTFSQFQHQLYPDPGSVA
jgi:peptidoglycan/xylan/chitin deacetylase (PgdA/CDA1 family)